MVEFALVLPVLLLVLFAIMQFGLAVNNWIEVTASARVGARKAAVLKGDSAAAAKVERAARDSVSTIDTSRLTVTVSPAPSWNTEDEVTVRTEYPARIEILGVTLFDGKLTGQSKIRVE